MVAALSRSDPDRHISSRQVGIFKKIPQKLTAPVFGKRKPGQFMKLSDDSLKNIVSGAESGLAFFDDVGDPIIPDFPQDTRFTILYTGLYCRDRTGDRGIFGASDEPYVITVVVSVENGANNERSETHPVGDPDQHYDDVDDGEWHRGPIAACWEGPQQRIELSLVSVVMENDEGDPDAYEDQIRNIVNLAAAIAAYFNIAVGAAIKAVAEDVIKWVIDSGDDEIGTAVEIVDPDRLKLLATLPTRQLKKTRTVTRPTGPFTFVAEEVEDQTDLEYHFVTHHDDSGEYFATFKIVADKEPVVRPQNSLEFVGGNQVVANF